ncbi:MAG: hypothetical protein ABFS56_11315 [Pseudomonadota bacterium]
MPRGLEKYNISTTLVTVVKKGINDHEIPEVINFSKKYRSGVVFQPVQEAGRINDFRLTLSEIP